MYSTKNSLIDTFGEKDVAALLKGRDTEEDPKRLEKAATLAASMINGKLGNAGYVLPLLWTGYDDTIVGNEDPPLPPKLNALLQYASDCLTVYYLSLSSSLHKKEFTDCQQEQMRWLDGLKMDKDSLPDYPLTSDPTGRGNFVVVARRSILDRPNGYPGCCGRRYYD